MKSGVIKMGGSNNCSFDATPSVVGTSGIFPILPEDYQCALQGRNLFGNRL